MKQRQFTIPKQSTDVPVKNPFVHRLNLGTVDVIKVSKSRKSGIDWSYVIYHCTNQSIYSWYTSHFGMESGSSISSFSKQRGKAETSYRMAKCAATSDCDPLPGGIFCRRISLDISQRNEGSYRRGSHHSPGPTFFILRCLACSISRLNNGSSKIRSGIGALFWKMLKYVIVKLCRSIFFVMGFHWVKVKGQQEPSSEAPVVCIAPHSSLFDAIVLCVGTELSGVVSAVDHTNIPFIGKLIQFTQPVFVSREDPNSRINTIKEIKKRAHSKGAWPQVVIFPEGTCTNRSCLIGFKPGGFYPGVPVQPVCVRYPNKLDTITWTWDGPEAFKVLWYTLCQFHNYVEIEFLPVHVPNEDEIKDARLFAENVRRRMAVCLDCAVTDHSYDDCRLMLRAAKLNIPASKGIIELHKMHKSLGVSFDAMKDLLEKCHSQVLNQSIDIVTLEEFADYLDIPKSENLQKLFNFYDQVGSDKIDFREYVVSLCLVSGPASVDDTVRMTFQLFEHRQDGFVTSQDLMCIFKHMFRMTKDETQQLFLAVDSDKDGQITYDELRHFARNQPECKKLYSAYQDHCNGLPNLCALDDNFLGSKYE